MSSEKSTEVTPEEETAHVEQERLQARARKVTDIVKGVAVAYVGLQLGLAAVRFVGRKIRNRRGTSSESRPKRQLSRASEASRQQSAQTPTTSGSGEDCWNPVDAPAPATPPHGYRPIVTTVLSCTPQELCGVLFSGAGTDLFLKQHREIGRQWDVAATPWRRASAATAGAAATAMPADVSAVGGGNGAAAAAAAAAAGSTAEGAGSAAVDDSLLGSQSVFEWVLGQPGFGGFTRLLTFVNPKKPPSSNDTRCVQRQQLVSYRSGVLIFASAMNMLDIPFRDCFTVNVLWRAVPGAAPGTTALTIHLKVHFIKGAMGMSGLIASATLRDSTDFFVAFTTAVESHIISLRQQAATPLPAPLPATTLLPTANAATTGSRGSRQLLRRVSPAVPVSPFAVAAGVAPVPASGPCSQPAPLPAWKQLRALLVFAVLAFTLLHQLHLGRELAALREDSTAAGGPRGSGGEEVAGVDAGDGSRSAVGLAGGLVASALGPLMSAAGSAHCVLQALIDRVAGRGPLGGALPGLQPPH